MRLLLLVDQPLMNRNRLVVFRERLGQPGEVPKHNALVHVRHRQVVGQMRLLLLVDQPLPNRNRLVVLRQRLGQPGDGFQSALPLFM